MLSGGFAQHSERVLGCRGKFGDFGEAWYLTVGTGIMLTMIISIFSAQITKVVALTKLGIAQCADRGFRFQKRSCRPFCDSGEHITHKASQKALEELYLGPEFTLEERYATLLNQFFVNMVRAGTPSRSPTPQLPAFFTTLAFPNHPSTPSTALTLLTSLSVT